MNQQLASLMDTYRDHFSIGTAISTRTMDVYSDLILKQFDSLTAENEMKFAELQPEPSHYDFSKADTIMGFARENGKKVRGHTLVWHNQTTNWVFTNAEGELVTREELLERMQSHIETVVGRYRGQIYAWDVVNEAIEDHSETYLRPSKWLQIIGPDFIDKAFEYAHLADPDALLFYNDYNETNPTKRKKIIRLVRELQDRGVPIHGIGLQAHWNIYGPSLAEIEEALQDYASLGLPLHITELDLSVFRFEDRRTDVKEPSHAMLEAQAEAYDGIFQLFRAYRAHIDNVTFWGVADDYTWLDDFPVRGRKNWPFLFDEQHKPKESFFRVVDF